MLCGSLAPTKDRKRWPNPQENPLPPILNRKRCLSQELSASPALFTNPLVLFVLTHLYFRFKLVLFSKSGILLVSVVCLVLTGINFKSGIVLCKDWCYSRLCCKNWYYSQIGIVLSLVFSSFKTGISKVIILAFKFPFPFCNHITSLHLV